MIRRWTRLLILAGAATLSGCRPAEPTSATAPPAPAAVTPQPSTGRPNPGPVAVQPAAPAPAPARPDFQVTAEAFAKEFTKDREAFKAKYANKVVEVTGTVHSVGQDIGGGGNVSLRGDPDVLVGNVLCGTAEREPWRAVLPGQTARVRGRCPDRVSVEAMLFDAVVLEVRGDPPPTVTADQLAKEFAADPDAAEKKWDKKYLILTGRVKQVIPPKDLNGRFLLLESDPATPRVQPDFGTDDRAKRVRPGQQVRVLAQSLGVAAEKDRLLFIDCWLLDVDR